MTTSFVYRLLNSTFKFVKCEANIYDYIVKWYINTNNTNLESEEFYKARPV